MTTKILDVIALGVLLDWKLTPKTRVATLRSLASGPACPECGAPGPHDDNGQTGAHLAYSCGVCGTCFDQEPV